MADPKFWVPYLKWDAFVADSPAEIGGDPDTDPDKKGIHGGVEVTARLSKGDVRAIRALTTPEHQLYALGVQDTRLDDGFLKLTAAQQEFGLLGKCSVLDLPEDVNLIYTFRPHHVTYNGRQQDLPSITIAAPVIPDEYDPEVSGPLIVNLADAEWLDASTAVSGGYVVRQIPDDVIRNLLTIQFLSNGSGLGAPLDISDLMWDGTSDSIVDATEIGKNVLTADTQAAARGAIGAISGGDFLPITATTDDVDEGATNLYVTTAEKSKLAGIEPAADVTDAANVNAAGAVMETDTSTASMQFVVDEDNMASDSATKIPTQQSVRAYVLAQIAALIGAAPAELDTWIELVSAIQDNEDALEGINTALSGKQALDATLTALAALSTAANKLIYADGADSFATTDLTTYGRTVLGYANAAALKAGLALAKADVGLGNVDNTADSAKPVSTAQAAADTAVANASIAKALMDAKGDLIVASGNDTPIRLPVGSNGQVITADSAEAAGVKWATPSSGGVGGIAAQSAYTAAAETTPSGGAYADLTTTTDQVTIDVGASGVAIVSIGAWFGASTANAQAYISFASTGANVSAAADSRCAYVRAVAGSTIIGGVESSFTLTGLTPGVTTFKMKYRANGGTGTYEHRRIAVLTF